MSDAGIAAATHIICYRVYYEDTDAAGIVYYANYLKFAERARTEWLRNLGFDHSHLLKEDNCAFVVRRCEIDFLSPARLDDMISVESYLQETGKVRMTMRQIVKRGDTSLAMLMVTLACVNSEGKPARLPPALIKLLVRLQQ